VLDLTEDAALTTMADTISRFDDRHRDIGAHYALIEHRLRGRS
jgi:hypothetical protein